MGCRTSPTNGEGGRIRQRVSAKSDGLGKARGSIPPCGCICMHRKRVNLSTVLAGQRVGIKEVDEGIWIVSFMHYDLGYIDLEQKSLQPLDNPFGSRLSPMS